MSVWGRLLDWLDDPRYCPDCGRSIEVECQPRFDEQTGEARGRWIWRCPEVYVVASHRAVIATWHGSLRHVWGQGRPRWHQKAKQEGVTL